MKVSTDWRPDMQVIARTICDCRKVVNYIRLVCKASTLTHMLTSHSRVPEIL